jgi:hypothetical protein
LCTKSGELAGQAVDLEVVLVIIRILNKMYGSVQEYLLRLLALSRILSIALRRSRVLGALAGHLARGPTTLGAAYARGLSVLKVGPLSVMCVSGWWRRGRIVKVSVFVVVGGVRFERSWRGRRGK